MITATPPARYTERRFHNMNAKLCLYPNGARVFVSYSTPVAIDLSNVPLSSGIAHAGSVIQTEEKFSSSTSRQQRRFIGDIGAHGCVKTVAQFEIVAAVRTLDNTLTPETQGATFLPQKRTRTDIFYR